MTDDVPPAWRCIHLQGGCRAHRYVSHWIRFEPYALDGSELVLLESRYGMAYAALRQVGLQIVGVDLYTDVEQAEESRLPDWRSYTRNKGTSWHCAKQADVWSQIAYSAIKKAQGPLWDIASRISYQIHVCEWRLRQLSEAYHAQLKAIVVSGRFKDRSGIGDGFTWLSYLAFQVLLVDSCVLRDYFAEFRALTLPPEEQPAVRVRSLTMLRQHHLEKNELATEVDRTLAKATAPGGWLHTLSHYRNLVVHYAPIASAERDLYAFCQFTRLINGADLPSIKLPIPTYPDRIITNRRSGTHLDDPRLGYARFANALKNPDVAPDALDYSLVVLSELAKLGCELAQLSPVSPRLRRLSVNAEGELSED